MTSSRHFELPSACAMDLVVNSSCGSAAHSASAPACMAQCAGLKSGPLEMWPRSARLNAHLLAAAKHVKLVRGDVPAVTCACEGARRSGMAVVAKLRVAETGSDNGPPPRTTRTTPLSALRAAPCLFEFEVPVGLRARDSELGGAHACPRLRADC